MFRPFLFRKPPPPRPPVALVLAHDLLPTELWDKIFRHLGWDEDFLQMAKVCKLFNILCISLFLARYKVPSLDSPELRVDSTILPALQLSDTPLRSQCLVCQFNYPVGVQRGLAALRDIIERSDTLRRVDVTFSQNLWDAHERDVWVPEALRSPWRMHHEFWSALSAMALKSPVGRVEIMWEDRFFEGRAADVAGWNRFSRRAAWNKMSFFRKRRTTQMTPQRCSCAINAMWATSIASHIAIKALLGRAVKDRLYCIMGHYPFGYASKARRRGSLTAARSASSADDLGLLTHWLSKMSDQFKSFLGHFRLLLSVPASY
ncbi:hypothetical protein FB45DRAFT_1064582 [Roridomyces roridus]|uniref:F-box domain-containing protein n=1 Tax=Roridomyces roridus TaxID=1738132 RepID=A0AAD7B9W0_9AGAR|nr:hypothetical protein FB45DRAFT_1064582 [Roridomyces roridus]